MNQVCPPAHDRPGLYMGRMTIIRIIDSETIGVVIPFEIGESDEDPEFRCCSVIGTLNVCLNSFYPDSTFAPEYERFFEGFPSLREIVENR